MQNNAEPLIHISKINIEKDNIRIMGSSQDTVKIEYCGVSYIKFHAKEFIEELQECTGSITLEIVGRANINEWMGQRSAQILIEDYEIKSNNRIIEF